MDWNSSAGGRNVAYGTLGLMVIFSIYTCWPDSAPEGGTSTNAAVASDATSNPEPVDQSENQGVTEQPSPETVVEADEQVEEATIVEESTTTDQTAGWKTQFPWSFDKAAVIEGTEIPKFRTSGNLGCYIYDEYIVKTTPYNDHTGEKISTFIRPKRIKETDLCEARFKDKIITIDIDDASWFDGINKDLMFIGFYTGPAGRLEVYDLMTKSKLHDIDYHDPITLKQGRYLSYEGFIKWVNSPDECPENEQSVFHEYGTGLAGDFNFDLLSGKETINKKYCRYFQ